MRRDETNALRKLLDEQPPRLATYVNTPWETIPDHRGYNADAFRLIERRLKAMARRTRPTDPCPSQGLLVLGEAGTGKTHLLMRVARTLSATNPVMFIHKPNNEEAVAQHIWSQLIESLTRETPGLAPGQSQLDHLLAHVFTAILIPLLEQDVNDGMNAKLKQRWLRSLQQSPNHLFGMLEGGVGRQKHLDFLRNKVLGHLRIKHPDVDQTIARALINYCFLASDRDRRSMLTWLMGQQIEETTAKRLGVGSLWCEDADLDDASDIDIRQQRQQQAIRAIQTVGDLSRYYRQPLILAFDQLEGLRNEQTMSRRWGDVVQQIFTVVPNMLIVTCIFPSLWETWFRQELHQAIKDRMAQDQVALDRFSPEHAEALLEAHMNESYENLNLPDPIYPFTEEDIAELCEQAVSPRVFLQRARQRLDDWLSDYEEIPVPIAAQPDKAVIEAAEVAVEPVSQSVDETLAKTRAIDKAVREHMESSFKRYWDQYDNQIPNEENFFGQTRQILQAVFAHAEKPATVGGKAVNGSRVMPTNVLIKPSAEGQAICFAVCYNQAASLKARLDNLIGALNDGKQCRQALILRDSRCPAPSGQAETLIANLNQSQCRHLIVGKQEFSLLQAIYDGLTSVEENDLVANDQPISEQEYIESIQNQGWLSHSQTLKTLEELNEQLTLKPPTADPVALPTPAPIIPPTLPLPTAAPKLEPVVVATSTSTASVLVESLLQPEITELIRLIMPDSAVIKANPTILPPLANFNQKIVFLRCEGEVSPPDAEGLDDPTQVRTNPNHAQAVAQTIERALQTGVPAQDIVVIPSYPSQAKTIRALVNNSDITIDVLENLPQRNWPLAIIDITDDQAPPTAITSSRDWLKTAFLKANRQLIIVGNPTYLTNFRFFPVASLLLFRTILSRSQIIPLANLRESA